MRKGSCPVTEERIASGVAAAKKILADIPQPPVTDLNHATAEPIQTL